MLKTVITSDEILAADEADTVGQTIAVIIPCYNEEMTVADVVRRFRDQLPDSHIYVFDNNSTDKTVQEALRADALVFHERRQGKGYVVQSMFRSVDADIYIMVDGDGTYPPDAAHELIAPIINDEADMVVGSRLHNQSQSQFKSLNKIGNRVFLYAIRLMFRASLTDILSGYRAFNRKFIKGVPLFGGGFEIETELTIKALERGYRILEVPVDLTHRPEGSQSKIRIVQDGALIMKTIFMLFRDYKPLTFFGAVGLALIVGGCVPGLIVVLEFIETGIILRLPSAILAVGLVLSGMLMILAGLILHTMIRRFQEFDHSLRLLTEGCGRIRAGVGSQDKEAK